MLDERGNPRSIVEVLSCILIFAVSFVVYLKTLCPTVYVVGSGELITAVHTLGIAHPTGYPLYTIIGRVLSLILPVGSVAYRLNMVSAIFASSAVMVLYYLLFKILNSRLTALVSSLILAFSLTFWSQAVIAEVYSLNIFFIASLFLVLILLRESRDFRYAMLFAFLYGLAVAHHLTVLLLLPALFLFLLMATKQVFRSLRRISILASLFVLGASPYLILPIRASLRPPFRWANIDTLSDFIGHITGRQYRNLLFSLPVEEVLKNLMEYGRLLSNQFTPFLLWIPVLGIALNFRRDRGIFGLLLLGFVANIFYGINYGVKDVAVFLIPSFFVYSIWMGYGLEFLHDKLSRKTHPILLSILFVLLPVWVARSNLYKNDLSSNFIPYNYGVDILRSLKPNAVLFTEGDDATFILPYLQQIEKLRPDVSAYSRSGSMVNDFYGEAFYKMPRYRMERTRLRAERELIKREERPVYYILRQTHLDIPGYKILPDGLCYRVIREGQQVSSNFWESCDPDSLDDLPFYKDYWVRKIISNYHFAKAEWLLEMADSTGAFLEYEKAGKVAFDSRSMQHNIGIVYLKLGRLDAAESQFRRATEIDPRAVFSYMGLSKIYYRRRDLNKALEACKKAIEIDPHLASAHNFLGIIYATEGDYLRAKRAWEMALKIDPYYRDAKENLLRLMRKLEAGWQAPGRQD